jgi:predicted  nucleic acid-binding Zn-ribbon protein
MGEKKLRQLMEELQKEIKNSSSADRKDQTMLAHLESEIREFLDRSEEEGGEIRPSIIRRLQESLNHFESSHPALTALISQVLDALSGTGI